MWGLNVSIRSSSDLSTCCKTSSPVTDKIHENHLFVHCCVVPYSSKPCNLTAKDLSHRQEGKHFYLRDNSFWQSSDKLFPSQFTDQQWVCVASMDTSPCPVWFQEKLHASLHKSSVQMESCFWASEAWSESRDKYVTNHSSARKSKARTGKKKSMPSRVKENIHKATSILTCCSYSAIRALEAFTYSTMFLVCKKKEGMVNIVIIKMSI